MTRETRSEAEAAAALRRALNEPDDLTCEQAQELIPALVDAELAGEDVDDSPTYAALLRHLDRCPECAELYATLAEDLESVLAGDEPAPLPRATTPAIFELARQTESIALRLFRGITKGFELEITDPRFTPSAGVLGGGKRIPLFRDNIPEITGDPSVVVALDTDPEEPQLLVVVRQVTQPTQWRVQIQIGARSYEALTDENGIVQMGGFSTEQLSEAGRITVVCTEEQAS